MHTNPSMKVTILVVKYDSRFLKNTHYHHAIAYTTQSHIFMPCQLTCLILYACKGTGVFTHLTNNFPSNSLLKIINIQNFHQFQSHIFHNLQVQCPIKFSPGPLQFSMFSRMNSVMNNTTFLTVIIHYSMKKSTDIHCHYQTPNMIHFLQTSPQNG
jgi:hypothetical protein